MKNRLFAAGVGVNPFALLHQLLIERVDFFVQRRRIGKHLPERAEGAKRFVQLDRSAVFALRGQHGADDAARGDRMRKHAVAGAEQLFHAKAVGRDIAANELGAMCRDIGVKRRKEVDDLLGFGLILAV